MDMELKGMKISDRIEEVEKEIHQAELNDRLGWEYDSLKSELRDLANELRNLGY